MISENSILRRIPSQLDRKQALFFDGIRHAAEIIDLAYTRLQATLTKIALSSRSDTKQEKAFTSAFLDAWAVVDGIDRFRSLWDLIPNANRASTTTDKKSFKELSQSARELRNVADHLAQRADFVVARKGSALGELTWFTAFNPQGTEGLSCMILPGTLGSGEKPIVNPVGKECTYPTGLIHLSAGGYRVCLSDLIPEIEIRVHSLEDALECALAENGLEGQQAGSDLLLTLHLNAEPNLYVTD